MGSLESLFPAPRQHPLLIGRSVPAWLHLPGAELVERPAQRRAAKRDLIVLDVDTAAPDGDLARLLGELRADLSDDGRLIIVVRNRRSYAALRDRMKATSTAAPARSTPGAVRRALARSGPWPVGEFLCMPGPGAPEEFVAPDSGLVHLPAYAPVVDRLAHRLGLYPRFHDGHIFIGAERGAPAVPIIRPLGEGAGMLGEPRLLRFDLRERGALVVFLEERSDGRRFVARVATGDHARRIARSHAAQLAVRGLSGLPESARSLIPEPVARFALADSEAFVEPMAEGSVAWKLVGTRVEARVIDQAIRFATELGRASVESTELSEPLLDRLFALDLRRAREREASHGPLAGALRQVILACQRGLRGQRLGLVRSHGDFGLGNVLADPRSGAMTAVIDWDTSRELELPLIDVLNLDVQRERRGAALPGAFATVESRLAGGAAFAPAMWGEFTPRLDAERRKFLLGACLVRYVSRSLEYPRIAGREGTELLDAARWWLRSG